MGSSTLPRKVNQTRSLYRKLNPTIKDKVKTTDKDKIKNIQLNSSRKYCRSGKEPPSISLRIKILSVLREFEREKCDIWTDNNVIN